MKQCFQNVFYCSDVLSGDQNFNELTCENLKDVTDTIKEEVEEVLEINNTIIFDDMGV